MAVALLALFLAASGVGYAATSLPNNSVGTAQIRNSAVTNPKIANGAVGNFKLASNAVGFRKIIPGTIGAVRVNKNAVQLRVSGTCTDSQAITAIQNNGKVTCGQTNPEAFNGGQAAPVTLTSPTTAAAVTGVSLAANKSYIVMANPQIAVNAASNARGHILVTCTLSVGQSTTATQARNVSFDVGFGTSGGGTVNATRQQSSTLPLQVSVPSSTAAQTAQVSCVSSLTGDLIGTPTVTAAGTIVALQTQSNTTLPSTVSTPPAPPTPANPTTTTSTNPNP
jgi:hypothetical protein